MELDALDRKAADALCDRAGDPGRRRHRHHRQRGLGVSGDRSTSPLISSQRTSTPRSAADPATGGASLLEDPV